MKAKDTLVRFQVTFGSKQIYFLKFFPFLSFVTNKKRTQQNQQHKFLISTSCLASCSEGSAGAAWEQRRREGASEHRSQASEKPISAGAEAPSLECLIAGPLPRLVQKTTKL